MLVKKESAFLYMKGFAMGMADIVPGVSGGTVALITGVYDKLIKSISSVNKEFISYLLKFDIKSALNHIDIKFLLPLAFGILSAIVSMAKVMHYFMEQYSIYTWSLFFGLILSSIFFVARQVPSFFSPKNLLSALIGTIIGYMAVSLIPVQTPDTSLMIFISGMIGICAMILPGISGSFILLILGKYLFVTSAIKNPFDGANIIIILTFASGCLVGLLSFSKVLNFFLNKYHNLMMSLLVGFMIGSMKKIWPWKEVISQKTVRGKTYTLEEAVVLPQNFGSEELIAFTIMFIGMGLVFIAESRIQK